MDKKALQEQRMRGYFIQATKELLRGEGLKSVSVRNIADHAGYSYATLYNYFRDVKDLIFECVKDFQEECESLVKEETRTLPRGRDRLKGIVNSYIKYFIQYPGIFELFFIESVSDIGTQRKTVDVIYRFLDGLLSDEWEYCIDNSIFSREEADNKNDQLRYCITGMLLFYLNRKTPETYDEFVVSIEKNLNILLD